MGCTSSSAALTAVVTNMWSPQTIGELQLSPGMSIFQAMFSVSLHRSGRAGSSATLPAFSPRNCGQCCAAASGAGTSSQPTPKMPIRMRFIVSLLVRDRAGDDDAAIHQDVFVSTAITAFPGRVDRNRACPATSTTPRDRAPSASPALKPGNR